jgi:hypothetical protein
MIGNFADLTPTPHEFQLTLANASRVTTTRVTDPCTLVTHSSDTRIDDAERIRVSFPLGERIFEHTGRWGRSREQLRLELVTEGDDIIYAALLDAQSRGPVLITPQYLRYCEDIDAPTTTISDSPAPQKY